MRRFFDLLFSIAGLVVLSPLFLIVLFVGWLDTGSPIFRQKRLGKDKKVFVLFKFRTMRIETPDVPSHLADANAITTMGKVLRVTKMDELLQLINVLRGDMSLVGPRPNLVDQHELTLARDTLGVYAVRPGITGIAQINGIDMSTPELLSKTDKQMIDQMSLSLYFWCIFRTVIGGGRGDAVTR